MKKPLSPPNWARGFFRWFCHRSLLNAIEGDLLELYAERWRERGKRNADFRFVVDVLLLFRPGIIRPTEHKPINTMSMYKNYLTVGWRSILKSKMFSLINISGLALGLTCSIFIALWVSDEYGMDAFHDDIDRLYKITSVEYSGDQVTGGYDTPGVLAEELKVVMPEVEYACTMSWVEWNTFAAGDKKMKIGGTFAGKDFFRMFSHELLMGRRETVLKDIDNIVISRSMAERLFGSAEAAMDKSVRFENYRDLKVTGVFENLPDNVSEKFDYLCSWDFFLERNRWATDWNNSGPTTYVKLHQGASEAAVMKKLQHFIKGYDKEYSDMDRLELGMQPYQESYLHNHWTNAEITGGKIEYVRLFEFVAVFILLIACINFMNLSTARAMKRAKEIGVRKVNGAMKGSLVTQFMFEAILFTSIAVLLSLILLQLLLPQFNLLSGKNIHSPLTNIDFWMGIGVLTLVTGIISGSYPAWMLSSFKAISVMKSDYKFGHGSGYFRKGLVVFQFSLSMIFIVGMIVVARQVDFIHNVNLGYEKTNLIYVRLNGDLTKKYNVFKDELLKTPGIVSVSDITDRPVQIQNSTGSVEWDGKAENVRPTFTQVAVGYDFVKTMDATLVAGRDFSEEYADSANYLINETAAKVIGYKDPIRMPLTFWGVKGTIVGVVKDFHFNSLHVAIQPMVIRLHRNNWGYVMIRVEGDKMEKALASIETLHNKFNPEFPFAHQFADEEYASLYQSEQVVKKLSSCFAFLAIFISTLGLLGLIIFSTEQRTKEVGVRKVLGADVHQLVLLLSKDFMKLVLLSALLATPLAYYMMKLWLDGFEYHIEVQWWVFAIAAVSAFAVALITVSVQAMRAARSNPVRSLRSE